MNLLFSKENFESGKKKFCEFEITCFSKSEVSRLEKLGLINEGFISASKIIEGIETLSGEGILKKESRE